LVALTHDNNIRWSPDAVKATIDSSARVFIIRGELPHAGLADLAHAALPKIDRIVARVPGPFIAFVRRRATKEGEQIVDVGEYPNWRDQVTHIPPIA
jgi:hypothetical protein